MKATRLAASSVLYGLVWPCSGGVWPPLGALTCGGLTCYEACTGGQGEACSPVCPDSTDSNACIAVCPDLPDDASEECEAQVASAIETSGVVAAREDELVVMAEYREGLVATGHFFLFETPIMFEEFLFEDEPVYHATKPLRVDDAARNDLLAAYDLCFNGTILGEFAPSSGARIHYGPGSLPWDRDATESHLDPGRLADKFVQLIRDKMSATPLVTSKSNLFFLRRTNRRRDDPP
mmetsp:Transcript_6059/g.18263  ORF Transcript_6059/g.18263 Transcript_6059/m.18263 type:complete len:236 (-) Transcript_6059:215-922(-)